MRQEVTENACTMRVKECFLLLSFSRSFFFRYHSALFSSILEFFLHYNVTLKIVIFLELIGEGIY